jgi:chromosome partitioning protein
MSKVIAIANHKGGVGKTTTTAATGAALAAKGYKTLLIDLDAQANLTYSLLPDERIEGLETTIYETLTKGEALPILEAGKNLYLTPSSLELAKAEVELTSRIAREQILTRALEDVRGRFDYILMDCPPSLGVLTTNALFAADEVYIPLTAEALPLKGLVMLEDVINAVREANGKLHIGGVIVTRYNRRKINDFVEEALRTKYGDKVFRTRIRESIAVAEAPLYKKDILTYSPTSNGAHDYAALADEIVERNK